MRISRSEDRIFVHMTEVEYKLLQSSVGNVDRLTFNMIDGNVLNVCNGQDFGKSFRKHTRKTIHPWHLEVGAGQVQNAHRIPMNKSCVALDIIKSCEFKGVDCLLPDVNDWEPLKKRVGKKSSRPVPEKSVDSAYVKETLQRIKHCEVAGYKISKDERGHWTAYMQVTV